VSRMTHEEASSLLPRFLNAVEALALSPERTIRSRLAWAYDQVFVFADQEIPEEINPQFREFCSIVGSKVVPPKYESHPDYPKTTPIYFLSPQKAKRAAELLLEMFGAIVYSLERTESRD